MPAEAHNLNEQDRLRDRVAAGLRAEQALPFIKPYLETRKQELLLAQKLYVNSGDEKNVYQTAIRLSEIETILDQVRAESKVGRRADEKLAGGVA